MAERVHEFGGRWYSRPACWLNGLIDTIRLGTLFRLGAWVNGHRWRETLDSKSPGHHLRCDECGREAIMYSDRLEEPRDAR